MSATIEPRVERASPNEWLKRFEIFRERFRLGLIDEIRFKEITRAFQFKDDLGHIWMPGAASARWYRWDRKQWTAAAPPGQLTANDIPLAIAVAWGYRIPEPPAPYKNHVAPSPESNPPPPAHATVPPAPRGPLAPNPLAGIPPRPVEAPRVPPESRSAPGAPPSTLLPRVEPPPPPPGKRVLPTDLPERGNSRGRSKPTNLPR